MTVTETGQQKQRDHQVKRKKKINWMAGLFVGPHIVFFALFFIIPLFYGLYVSFTNWDLVTTPQWVGLANYKTILFDASSVFHSEFFNGLKNTFIFVVFMVPLEIIVPLLIAMALNSGVKAVSFFQSVFYLPGLFSISAVALIWNLVFNKRLGPINNLFHSAVNWSTTQPHAWAVILIVSAWWGLGGNMIIYRAALAAVPKELYESADMDGANSWRKFLNITLPSIRFQLLYTLVMTTLRCFNIYGQPVMLTNGGPNQTTTVLMMYIKNLAFGTGQSLAGMASAMAILLGLIMVIISVIQYLWLSKDNTH